MHGATIKTNQLIPYKEMMAVCSEIHTKHTCTVAGRTEKFWVLNFAVCKETIRSQTVAYPGILFRGGLTNSVQGRQNGDLGASAPYSGILEAAVIWYKKFHII